ncbi:hypothetical protein LELG_02820 [Lodderomyces elongisporus NRRL YB-4239]|uniref:mitogen-activated protein kinase kinase n=1 Tax=Lodderomyces elongisporus (strain ATCC 11503 / CBS 2605 / JCM 1781 / NBRC 1676 / NRRL YB-4239) TaxID=379508 RepID=A5DZN3_LODEL|nr:hypothetical protein LELG_02820 [Lodderomyces elongisporus NRRL YB-4239]
MSLNDSASSDAHTVDSKLLELNLNNDQQNDPHTTTNNNSANQQQNESKSDLKNSSGNAPEGLASPPTPTPRLPTSLSASNHPLLNSDMQARLMAFQQRRSKPASEPVNAFDPNLLQPPAPQSTAGSNSDSILETVVHNTTVETMAPSAAVDNAAKNSSTLNTENTNTGINNDNDSSNNNNNNSNNHTANTNDYNNSTVTNSSQAPPSIAPPSLNMPDRSNPVALKLKSVNNVPVAASLGKKPSLSQRRGMKLNTSAMPFNNPLGSPSNLSPGASTNKPINSTGVSPREESNSPFAMSMGKQFGQNELSRRLSERKKKPNFKLNLSDSSSSTPSRNNSLGKSATPLSSDTSQRSSASSADLKEEPQLQGLFANYSKYIDIKSGQLNFAGKASLHSKGIDFLSGSSFRVSLEEFEYLEELGRGNYGSVLKVLHKPTKVLMAMKEVRLELDETKFTQILMELDILHKCVSPYIVDFYGAFFVEGAVYMCIEYMDGGSLDQIFGNNIGIKDEAVLAYITESVTRGLRELKDNHNIIHRDVKPTNILVNSAGKVKLCDFGVSGNLVASMAKTNIGCQSYMAPERIKSTRPDDATYSVQSDVWSLGLTILEIACGHYPYPAETYGNIFSQLSAIVDGEPPNLDPQVFSKQAQFFVKSCLNKNPDLRPSYGALLQNPWLVEYRDKKTHLDELVQNRINELKAEKKGGNKTSATGGGAASADSIGSAGNSNKNAAAIPAKAANSENVSSLLKGKVRAPALHRGGLQSVNRSFLNR